MSASTVGWRRRAGAALLAVLAVAGAGCRSSKTLTATGSATINPADIGPGDGVFSRSLGGTLELKVAGAVTAAWKGATPLRVVHSASGNVPREGWLLSVGLEEPVLAAPGIKVRPAFDIVGYRGDGKYRVNPKPAAGGSTEPQSGDGGSAISGALNSTAFLVVNQGDAAESRNYEVIQQACTITVSQKGLTGSVDCPANTDTKSSVAFQWSWKADPGQVIQDDSTPTGATPTTAPAQDASGSKADPDAPLPKPTKNGDLKMVVTLSATCATIGQKVDVLVETEPEADLTLATAFSDARPHGLYELGTADKAGRYRWSFVVPPDAPPGTAYVLVAANEAEGERSAGATNPFKVETVKC